MQIWAQKSCPADPSQDSTHSVSLTSPCLHVQPNSSPGKRKWPFMLDRCGLSKNIRLGSGARAWPHQPDTQSRTLPLDSRMKEGGPLSTVLSIFSKVSGFSLTKKLQEKSSGPGSDLELICVSLQEQQVKRSCRWFSLTGQCQSQPDRRPLWTAPWPLCSLWDPSNGSGGLDQAAS